MTCTLRVARSEGLEPPNPLIRSNGRTIQSWPLAVAASGVVPYLSPGVDQYSSRWQQPWQQLPIPEISTRREPVCSYGGPVITTVLGAPGSCKSTVAQPLAALLPTRVVLDWDAFMVPATASPDERSGNPDTWLACR